MNEFDFETRMRSMVQRMKYPPTPDIAKRVITRLNPIPHPRFISKRLAWSLTLVLLFSLMLIPPVRAAILDFIEIGVVRIFLPAESPIFEIPRTAMPESVPVPTATLSPQDLFPLLNRLEGEVTLDEAKQLTEYSILLPSYPPKLGEPDLVFVQDVAGAMTVLVWLDPAQPERILISLHFIPNESWAIRKFTPLVIEETEVNGKPAIWASGPYPLVLSNGEIELTRLINGHTLIWADDEVTYRLETDFSLEEVIRIAESLHPLP